MEEPKESQKTKLDCCSHTFCFDDIKQWVQEQESNCPLCRRSISKLLRVAPDGQTLEHFVERKLREEPIASCEYCQEAIYQVDLSIETLGLNQSEHLARQCFQCKKRFIHVRCMDPSLIELDSNL